MVRHEQKKDYFVAKKKELASKSFLTNFLFFHSFTSQLSTDILFFFVINHPTIYQLPFLLTKGDINPSLHFGGLLSLALYGLTELDCW